MNFKSTCLWLICAVFPANAMRDPAGHDVYSAAVKPPVPRQDQPHRTGPEGTLAMGAEAFLESIGVVAFVDQGVDPGSYVEPLRYLGIRQVRDGARNVAGDVMLHRETSVRYVINAYGNMEALLAAGRTLAAAGALLALEGPNEPNNFPVVYQGETGGGGINKPWAPVARFQRDLYAAVKEDPILKGYPVLGPSEVGAESENVGLQFLVVPQGADTLFPAGTRYADFANVHNYVTSNMKSLRDNQAWNAADPTLNAEWDGLYGNHGVTWSKHYTGYSNQQLEALPRVTTETGWDTATDPGGERTQGTILTNTYLAQFKRGWRHTFIYNIRDHEGGAGHQGLYKGMTPKLAATFIHNLTTILADTASLEEPGRFAYSIPSQPNTVHDLLLQKSKGSFTLVVWNERAQGSDDVDVNFGKTHSMVKVYDITSGTAPVQTLNDVQSVHLTLSDHACILEISG